MKKINTDGTFKENKDLSIHRWYPYVEGFSEQFVLDCLKYNKDAKIIYDPFNGSGTTGIVASKLNRKYIGIEKEKTYLDLTIKRKVNDTNEKRF